MITRRQLLARGTTLLLLVPFVHACGSDDDAQNTLPDAAGNGGTCGVEPTSTVVNAHTHVVCVLTSDLTSPPAGGVTYTTSSAAGHTHTVMLTSDQLVAIDSGTAVNVQTSLDDQHTHGFTISKLAASRVPA